MHLADLSAASGCLAVSQRNLPSWRLCASADEAVAGGAAGLVYVRVKEGGQIEAAKPVMEGLSPEQQAALVQQMQVGGWGRQAAGSRRHSRCWPGL